MDETEAVRTAATLAEALVVRTLEGDTPAATRALLQLWRLPEIAQFAAFSTLADTAILGVPRGLRPGDTWVPRMRMGNPPQDVDPAHPAAVFVMRFITSVLSGDDEARMDLWARFVRREAGTEVSKAEIRDVAAAFVLMTELAARGFRREWDRRQRPHRHPQAPRRPNRTHRRDQRRR